jgi:hypothetical protein
VEVKLFAADAELHVPAKSEGRRANASRSSSSSGFVSRAFAVEGVGEG